MITPGYCQTMARYNAWQNQSIFTAANALTDTAREQDRGVFFGSIRRTLSHLMWGDLMWMSRFEGGEGPRGGIAASPDRFDWTTLMAERPKLDARIAGWAWMVTPEELAGELSWYSGALGRDLTKPYALCVMHVFNHQTHHRGQVHAMLTAAGARPDDTDLPFMPDEIAEWR
ncbi:DinB family protein [Roseicyclus mahoneyensis]|uniref:Putative damage-inducible protein DinB n=1 Tax=Roseicyclus mahoneyensis TaxID=164332 RepID=A0A316GQZ8_9RHOB|nr:DinB family protein [Roseicyclus mahoneyensis]PWK62452.1 putative damage-inducible protein DinB [Roseicyclus mahoneyensis]